MFVDVGLTHLSMGRITGFSCMYIRICVCHEKGGNALKWDQMRSNAGVKPNPHRLNKAKPYHFLHQYI